MDRNSIRRLITEAVSEVMTGEMLQKDIPFLKDYQLVKSGVISGANTWKFAFKTPDGSYMSYAFLVQYPNEACKMRLEVDWKIASRHNTAGAGRDFVMTFGPYRNYQEMVSEVNRRMTNNPLIGPGLYKDNNDLMLDREIITLLKQVCEKIGEIREVGHPALKTLEKMHDAVKDMSDDELGKFCDDNFRGWAMKQGIVYKLQDIHKLPYYKSLKSKMHAPLPQKQ